MTYWWVSQGKYYAKELTEGYLWVPKHHRSGIKIHHWLRIKELKIGDVVFSYVNGTIVAVSKVTSEFYEAKRPIPIPGRDIFNEGLKINLKCNLIPVPLKVANIVYDLQKILEKQSRYKPLNKNGYGNQGYIYPLVDEAGDFILNKIGIEIAVHQ